MTPVRWLARQVNVSRGPVLGSRGCAALRASDAPGPRAGLGIASAGFWGCGSDSPGGPSRARAAGAALRPGLGGGSGGF